MFSLRDYGGWRVVLLSDEGAKNKLFRATSRPCRIIEALEIIRWAKRPSMSACTREVTKWGVCQNNLGDAMFAHFSSLRVLLPEDLRWCCCLHVLH
ncbi:hypothetical protein FXO37_04487 [Capsicum annuum]|nr:hypothetical protein FXO37_04487 [Capsicum annuum]